MPEIEFMKMAVDLAREGMQNGNGGPFGCVIVKEGQVIGRGNNSVLVHSDPTAHAEIVAIREACKNLGHFQLNGCEVYTSCEPCPMCLGALYWARPDKIYYANSREDAAAIGFDDSFIYNEITLPVQERKIPLMHLPFEDALLVFNEWQNWDKKAPY